MIDLYLYVDVFGKGEKYHYYIFSKGGFAQGLQELADKGEAKHVSLQDIYKDNYSKTDRAVV